MSGLPWKRLDQIGLDLPALNNALGEGAALAATWVAAALLTGVLESDARRYDQTRVLLTWTMAASAAQAVKYSAGWNAGDGSFKTGDAITDAAMTLVLMVGIGLWYLPELRRHDPADTHAIVDPAPGDEVGPSASLVPAERLDLEADPHTGRIVPREDLAQAAPQRRQPAAPEAEVTDEQEVDDGEPDQTLAAADSVPSERPTERAAALT